MLNVATKHPWHTSECGFAARSKTVAQPRPRARSRPSLLLPQLLDSSSHTGAGHVELEQAQQRNARARQRAPPRHACVYNLHYLIYDLADSLDSLLDSFMVLVM